MTEIKLTCECHNEILCVDTWENDFTFVVYKYAPIRYSLWRRIKFLFSGHIEYNEVILSAENASKLADFIKNELKVQYDTHTHTGNAGVPTSPPLAPFSVGTAAKGGAVYSKKNRNQ